MIFKRKRIISTPPPLTTENALFKNQSYPRPPSKLEFQAKRKKSVLNDIKQESRKRKKERESICSSIYDLEDDLKNHFHHQSHSHSSSLYSAYYHEDSGNDFLRSPSSFEITKEK